VPNSDELFRRSSSSIPRLSSQMGIVPGPGSGDAADAGSLEAAAPIARVQTTPQPASKMGWDTQPAPRQPRAIPFTKLALVIAPLLIILGVLIGRLVSTSGSSDSLAELTPAAPMVPPPEPSPAPTVSPLPAAAAPDPAPAADEPAAGAGQTVRASEPASAKQHQAAAASPPPAKRAAVSKPDAPPQRTTASGLKLDMPTLPVPSPPVPAAPPASTPPPPQQVATATPASQTVAALPQAPAPPTPPAPPQTVAPTALDANRIAGEKDIVPDERTQSDIFRSGVEKVIGSYKVCISAEGSVSAVSQLKSTGFPTYDATILDTIRSKWRYRPFIVNGKAAAVCTAVRFIYLQK